jgi:hypothetical protein
MPCMKFESTIPASDRAKPVHASDRSASMTGTTDHFSYLHLHIKFIISIYKGIVLHIWVTFKVGRTPAYVKICNSQDTTSATWRKERSTVETNEIMKNRCTPVWVMMLTSAFVSFISCLDACLEAVGVRSPSWKTRLNHPKSTHTVILYAGTSVLRNI